MRLSRLLVLMVLCHVVGCRDSTGGGRGLDAGADAAAGMDAGASSDAGPDAAADGLTVLQDAWCPTYAARLCAAAESCGCLAVPGFGQAAACLKRAEAGCRTQLARFQGDARIVAAGAVPDGCLVALDTALADCRLPAPELFAVQCPLVWPSDLSRELPAAGMSCAGGLCAQGTRCSLDERCIAPKSGGPCAGDGDCPEQERCGELAQCVPLAFGMGGKSCDGPDACSDDTTCLASNRRVCAARQADSRCSDDAECADGAYCMDEQCAASPTENAPCGNGVACALGLACRIAPGPGEGTCQTIPKAGEPCALGRFGPFICEAGLACRDRMCGAVPGNGEACASFDPRCEDGLGCHVEGADSICRPRVPAGETCALDDSCASGLFCDFGEGRCAAFLAEGETCTDGNECGPAGACVPDADNRFRCVPQPGLGDVCFLDDCAPGLSCQSPFQSGVCAPPLCAAFAF